MNSEVVDGPQWIISDQPLGQLWLLSGLGPYLTVIDTYLSIHCSCDQFDIEYIIQGLLSTFYDGCRRLLLLVRLKTSQLYFSPGLFGSKKAKKLSQILGP